MLRITIGASWQVQEYRYIYIYILFFYIKISKHQTSILVIRDSALSVNRILHSPYNKLYSSYGEETKTEVIIFQLG